MGQAMAVRFAACGCQRLFLVDLNIDGLQATQKLVEEANSSAEVQLQVTDITSSSGVEAMVKSCVQTFGRLDFAMNNAGFAVGGIKTADLSTTLFDKICTVNEKGVRTKLPFK